MAKKPVRNKAREILVDYYRTNREISKQDEERYKAEQTAKGKPKWSGSEKKMLAATIIACVLLGIKLILT